MYLSCRDCLTSSVRLALQPQWLAALTGDCKRWRTFVHQGFFASLVNVQIPWVSKRFVVFASSGSPCNEAIHIRWMGSLIFTCLRACGRLWSCVSLGLLAWRF